MSIIPAHIMRSMGGGYDNESIAVTAMVAVFWLWCRSVRTPGSWPIAVLAGLAHVYMVAAWGGYVFVINMVSRQNSPSPAIESGQGGEQVICSGMDQGGSPVSAAGCPHPSLFSIHVPPTLGQSPRRSAVGLSDATAPAVSGLSVSFTA